MMNMIQWLSAGALLSLSIPFAALAEQSDGVILIKSSHSVAVTADKLESALLAKGMTLFKRISHSDGAAKAGVELRPTELLIFGNPAVGAPLMRCGQMAGLDLPQKALIYEDKAGVVWFAYNDPSYITERHDVAGCDEVIDKISNALDNFARAATR